MLTGGTPPPRTIRLARLSACAARPAQATPRRVELPFCLAILLRDKASDGRPLRLVAATAALLFPQQEEVFKASPSIQVPLAVADADGAPPRLPSYYRVSWVGDTLAVDPGAAGGDRRRRRAPACMTAVQTRSS
jgi:hypothetical protein